jgi:hypothetical protein
LNVHVWQVECELVELLVIGARGHVFGLPVGSLVRVTQRYSGCQIVGVLGQTSANHIRLDSIRVVKPIWHTVLS